MKLVKLANGKKIPVSNKEIEKTSGQYDAIKSVRKQMPKPGYAWGDDRPEYDGGVEEEATIGELEREALITCQDIRGHQMGEWQRTTKGRKNISTCECQKCGKYVQVIDLPQPNEIDIGGTAVALSCVD